MIDAVWHRSEDWVGTEIEDSFVMVNIESGRYVALNRTANAVWDALATPRSESELRTILRARFDVAEDVCGRALAALLGTMESLNLAMPR